MRAGASRSASRASRWGRSMTHRSILKSWRRTAYTTPGRAKKAASASAHHDVRRACQQESKDCS